MTDQPCLHCTILQAIHTYGPDHPDAASGRLDPARVLLALMVAVADVVAEAPRDMQPPMIHYAVSAMQAAINERLARPAPGEVRH